MNFHKSNGQEREKDGWVTDECGEGRKKDWKGQQSPQKDVDQISIKIGDFFECVCVKKKIIITFPAARPSRTMPSFKPETCEDVEDEEDEAPPAFDAGKIFIFFFFENPTSNNRVKFK